MMNNPGENVHRFFTEYQITDIRRWISSWHQLSKKERGAPNRGAPLRDLLRQVRQTCRLM
jgi:hypothetical protein